MQHFNVVFDDFTHGTWIISPNLHTYAKFKLSRICLKNIEANVYKIVRISTCTKNMVTINHAT